MGNQGQAAKRCQVCGEAYSLDIRPTKEKEEEGEKEEHFSTLFTSGI